MNSKTSKNAFGIVQGKVVHMHVIWNVKSSFGEGNKKNTVDVAAHVANRSGMLFHDWEGRKDCF